MDYIEASQITKALANLPEHIQYFSLLFGAFLFITTLQKVSEVASLTILSHDVKISVILYILEGYLEGILVLDDVGVFQLFKDSNLTPDLLLWDEFSIHLFDRYFPTRFDVAASIDLTKRALSNTIFLGEDVVTHLNLNILVHNLI